MRLHVSQLQQHLNQATLAPIYCVSGDEPLQKLECVDLICRSARLQSFNERLVLDVDHHFDWDRVNEACSNSSLFSSRILIELRLTSPKPGKIGAKILLEYAKKTNKENMLVISSDKLDKNTLNTQWLKTIEKNGVLVQVWPVQPSQLPNWIQARIKSYNKELSPDAARLIARHVEGNLLAAKQEIEKLDLLVNKKRIDAADVVDVISNHSRYGVFDMIETAYLGDAHKCMHVLQELRHAAVEPLMILGALMWEYRRTYSMAVRLASGEKIDKIFADYRVWDQKKRVFNAVLKRHDMNTFNALLNHAASIDKAAKKGQKIETWDGLQLFLLSLANADIAKMQMTVSRQDGH